MTKITQNLPQNPSNNSKRRQNIGLAIAIFLIVANGFAIIREFSYLPVITMGIIGGYVVLFHTNWALYLTAFCTPLSVIISNKNIHLSLSLPSEVLMITLTLLFFIRIFYDLHIKKDYIKHPVSIVIFIYLAWMFITCLTSVRPVVSFKHFASKLWFVTCCYWMFMQLADDGWKQIVSYFNCYASGLAIVVLITTIKHALSGFDEHYAHWVMSPFYNDHTAYGAALAFMIPVSVGFVFLKGLKQWQKIFCIVMSVTFLIGFYLSFSRAAWLSLVAAVAVLVILKLRIKLSWLFGFGFVFALIMMFYANDILYKLSKNSQDSSGNFVEHVQSISNISTDASNMERINRWTAAFGMIREKPFFGWGPGTYQFEYAPFQQAKYQTVISTDFGDGGNAHSEYINPCAESGIFGMLTVFALLISVIYCGIKTYKHSSNRNISILSLIMTLSLVTYFTHGIFNNFLDTDKLSLLFWSALAVITVCNVTIRNTDNQYF